MARWAHRENSTDWGDASLSQGMPKTSNCRATRWDRFSLTGLGRRQHYRHGGLLAPRSTRGYSSVRVLCYDNPTKPTQGPSVWRGKPCLETGQLTSAHSPFPQPLTPVPEPSGNEYSGDLSNVPFLFSVEHDTFSL